MEEHFVEYFLAVYKETPAGLDRSTHELNESSEGKAIRKSWELLEEMVKKLQPLEMIGAALWKVEGEGVYNEINNWPNHTQEIWKAIFSVQKETGVIRRKVGRRLRLLRKPK